MDWPPSCNRVVVDDTSPSIQYGNSWNEISSGPRDATLTGGPVFGGTLHSTTSNTLFSFNFTGTDFIVFSSVNPVVADGTVQGDPQWECIVDGNSLGVDQIDQSNDTPQNNVDICHGVLWDGPHELVVLVTSMGNPFYLDDIQYRPSADADLSNTVLEISNSDPNVNISADFQKTDGVFETQETGGTVSFDFNGTSVAWVGSVFAGFANQSATATWSVDGSSPVSFSLPTSSVDIRNSIFFTTNNVTAGQHTLLVTYQGNTETMPLTLDYFFLRNDVGNVTTTTAASSAGRSHAHSATIALGVVLGVLVVCIILAGLVLVRKRRRRTYLPVNQQVQQVQQVQQQQVQQQQVQQVQYRPIAQDGAER